MILYACSSGRDFTKEAGLNMCFRKKLLLPLFVPSAVIFFCVWLYNTSTLFETRPHQEIVFEQGTLDYFKNTQTRKKFMKDHTYSSNASIVASKQASTNIQYNHHLSVELQGHTTGKTLCTQNTCEPRRRKLDYSNNQRNHHSAKLQRHASGKAPCRQQNTCLPRQDLNRDDYWMHMQCSNEAITYLQQSLDELSVTLNNCSCSLHRGRKKYKRVALVSLPGSGNTWLRGLLELATETCTGSMWCDPNLRATHFCGEGLRSARTLVIKNHDPSIRWRGDPIPRSVGTVEYSEYNKPEFDVAVFVLRDPFDSIVAEHNRAIGYKQWEAGEKRKKMSSTDQISSHHIQHFGAEYFGEIVCNGSYSNYYHSDIGTYR